MDGVSFMSWIRWNPHWTFVHFLYDQPAEMDENMPVVCYEDNFLLHKYTKKLMLYYGSGHELTHQIASILLIWKCPQACITFQGYLHIIEAMLPVIIMLTATVFNSYRQKHIWIVLTIPYRSIHHGVCWTFCHTIFWWAVSICTRQSLYGSDQRFPGSLLWKVYRKPKLTNLWYQELIQKDVVTGVIQIVITIENLL